MEYQYFGPNLANLDYNSLVNQLLNPITPNVRKLILDRLTIMNDQLISISIQNQPFQPLNQQFQPLNQQFQMQNQPTMKLDIPISSISSISSISRVALPTPRKKDVTENVHPSLERAKQYNSYKPNIPSSTELDFDLDVDEILNEIAPESDTLESKLESIYSSYDKVIAEKKRRRRERNK